MSAVTWLRRKGYLCLCLFSYHCLFVSVSAPVSLSVFVCSRCGSWESVMAAVTKERENRCLYLYFCLHLSVSIYEWCGSLLQGGKPP